MPEPLDAAILTLTRLSRVLERAAAPLSVADFRALSAIVDGEARASRLARRLAVGKPSISATVESLARRGLILRRRTDDDHRTIALSPTAEGRTAYADALARMRHALDDLVSLAPGRESGLGWLADVGDAIEADRARRADS